MTVRLEEQIRRYTEAVDALSAPLEELMPAAPPGAHDIEPTSVEVTIPLRPQTRRKAPGWAYVLAAAAVVIVLAVPLWLLRSTAPDVADTTTPPVATTVPSIQPPGPDAYVYVDMFDRISTNGEGWAAESPVRVSVNGSSFETIGKTRTDGSFNLPFPLDVSVGRRVTVEVGGVPTTSVVPMMDVTVMDEIGDRVLGQTDLPTEASCCVSVFLFTSPTDNQAEEFGVTITDDGSWAVDLSGVFDVTNFTQVDVIYGDPNGLWLAWLGVRPDGATSPGPVFNEENGHYYEAVRVPGGIPWDDARAAAESRAFGATEGHLVAVDSHTENEFLVTNLPGAFTTGPFLTPYWLGGFQTSGSGEPGEGWQWVTGEPWTYQKWAEGEPNDSTFGEDCLHAHHDPSLKTFWNDQPCDSPVDGYIVEYPVGG